MSEFLIEAYLPKRATGYDAPRPEDLSRAARQLTEEGHRVRFLRAVFVPMDETCFYLFEADSDDAVAETARRCGLRFERLTEAVSDWTPAPKVLSGESRTEGDNR